MEYDSCSEAFDNHQEADSYVVRTKQAVAVGFLIGILTFLGIKKNINLEDTVRHCEKILENHPEYGLSPKEKIKLIGMVQHLAMFISEYSDEEYFGVLEPVSETFQNPNQFEVGASYRRG